MSKVGNNYFNVSIYTPKGLQYSEDCDCVTFWTSEGKSGNDFGNYGVKKGHADAVFSLSEGIIFIKKDGVILYSIKGSEGFAVMDKGALSITLEKIFE